MCLGTRCPDGWETGEEFVFPGGKIGCLGLPQWVLGRPEAGERAGWSRP